MRDGAHARLAGELAQARSRIDRDQVAMRKARDALAKVSAYLLDQYALRNGTDRIRTAEDLEAICACHLLDDDMRPCCSCEQARVIRVIDSAVAVLDEALGDARKEREGTSR